MIQLNKQNLFMQVLLDHSAAFDINDHAMRLRRKVK